MAVKVFNAGYPRDFVSCETAVMGLVETPSCPMNLHEVLEVKGRMCLRMGRVTGRVVTGSTRVDRLYDSSHS